MKKLIVLGFTSLLIMGLSSCNSSTATTVSNTAGSNSEALSAVEEVALGTLRLEGTSQAVDKAQAASLLPLWQVYAELQRNNSTATEEVDAVLSQIQSSMTSDQLKAIHDLKLTSKDLSDTLASLGIFNPPAGAQWTQAATNGQNVSGGGQVDTGSGDPLAGGVPPSDGGGPQNGAGGPPSSSSVGTNLSQSQVATMQASGGTAQGTNGITGLIEKLISILQEKVQA